MSYKTLTEQYNYKLKKKICSYVHFELAGLEIEFENYFNVFSKKQIKMVMKRRFAPE
jgi:hypothetical protein